MAAKKKADRAPSPAQKKRARKSLDDMEKMHKKLLLHIQRHRKDLYASDFAPEQSEC